MDNSFQNSTIAQIIEAIIEQLSFEGESKSDIADILLSILNQTTYDKEPRSVIAELFIMLKSKIEGEPFDPFDKSYTSRISEILLSIINETEYNEDPQSRIAELLLELKAELEAYTEVTVSGAVCSFETNISKPLVSLKADIDYQEDGVSEVNIYQLGGNLFDKDNITTGKLINGSGNEVTYSSWNISDYIPVISGASYYLYGLTRHPNTQQDNFELFDADKVKISFANVKTYNQPFVIPEGVSYVKFSVNDDDLQTAQFSVALTNYEPYNSIINKISIDISSYNVYGGYITVTATSATLTSTKNADGSDKDTPDIYDLSNITDFITFIGVNNIFTDTGDTEIVYLYNGEPPLSAPLSFGLGLNSLSLEQPDIISDIEQADIIEEE